MSIRKIFVTVLALVLGASAFAQVEFGAKAGMTANWIPGTYADLGDDPATNIGYYGGLTASLDLSRSAFLQAELLYIRKGISTENPILGKYARNVSYVELPVLAGYKKGNFRLMAGPAFAYCIGNTVKSDTYNPASLGVPRDFDLSVVCHTSYLVTDNLGVDLGFDFGVTRVLKDAVIGETMDKGRNSSVTVGLSYYFGN